MVARDQRACQCFAGQGRGREALPDSLTVPQPTTILLDGPLRQEVVRDLPVLQGCKRRGRRGLLPVRDGAAGPPAWIGSGRPLRGPASPGPRRHGRGSQGLGPRPRGDRGPEGPARGGGGLGGSRQAVSPRDQAGPQGPPPQRVRHPRVRSGRGAAVHRHGVRGGGGPAEGPAGGGPPAGGRGLRRGDPVDQGTTGHPCGGDRPPRPQDGQHHARPQRRRTAHGLRHRQALRGRVGHPGHGHRHGGGNSRVHEPGADP